MSVALLAVFVILAIVLLRVNHNLESFKIMFGGGWMGDRV